MAFNFFNKPPPLVARNSASEPSAPARNSRRPLLPQSPTAHPGNIGASAPTPNSPVRSSIPARKPPRRPPTKRELLYLVIKRHAALQLSVPIIQEAHSALCHMEDSLLQTIRTVGCYAPWKRVETLQDPIIDFKEWANLLRHSKKPNTRHTEFVAHAICSISKPVVVAVNKLDIVLAELVETTQEDFPTLASLDADLQSQLTCIFHSTEKMLLAIGILIGGLVEQPQGALSSLQSKFDNDVEMLQSTIKDRRDFHTLNDEERNAYAGELFRLAMTVSIGESSGDTKELRAQQALAICRYGYRESLSAAISRLKDAESQLSSLETIDWWDL